MMRTSAIFKRNGKWQAVSWQATRMPRPVKEADEVRKEVVAAQTAFHQAMLAADLKTLDGLADESFIWTHRDGRQATKRQLLDELGSGQLKYSKLETSNVTVAVYDDSSVMRGTSLRQGSAFLGPTGSGDTSPPFHGLLYDDVYQQGRRLEGCGDAYEPALSSQQPKANS